MLSPIIIGIIAVWNAMLQKLHDSALPDDKETYRAFADPCHEHQPAVCSCALTCTTCTNRGHTATVCDEQRQDINEEVECQLESNPYA